LKRDPPFNNVTFLTFVTVLMHAGDPALIDFIRDTIRHRGPLPFVWFMEQALYHPEHGYYSSDRCAIGRGGDYITSVSAGPLFGKMLAAQFAEIWEKLDCPNDFTVVEQGAHHGEFAFDVLETLRDQRPEFFSVLRYRIIEPFPILRARQAGVLRSFADKTEWQASVKETEPFCGVHFSNELLDAMPVHLLRAAGDPAAREWRERFVERTSCGFTLVERPLSDARLPAQLTKIPAAPPGDYETEINLAALEWIEAIAHKLLRGVVLVADYGHVRWEFYSAARTAGTLQCYAQHRVVPSPLEGVGETDITAHVEWTSLAERAEECGLRVAGFADQHHFLTGLLASDPLLAGTATAQSRALQTILHPEILGSKFQFLALTKDVSAQFALSGFKFGRDPFARLALRPPEDA
jgi:SAM-dependent MidA family methyltransferase